MNGELGAASKAWVGIVEYACALGARLSVAERTQYVSVHWDRFESNSNHWCENHVIIIMRNIIIALHFTGSRRKVQFLPLADRS